MKKIIFLLMLVFLSVMPVIAQDPPKDESNAIEVVDRVFDRTTEAVQQLADALKVPAEHVYKVLVQQQIIQGISLLVVTMVTIIFAYLSWLILKNRHDFSKNEDAYDQDTEGYWVLFILLGVASIVLVIVSIAIVPAQFINPEYGAIKDILGSL